MLKRTILAFLVLTGLATAADKYTELQGLGPLPEYVVNSTTEKIVVDGRLSESAWSKTTPITLMFPWDFQTGSDGVRAHAAGGRSECQHVAYLAAGERACTDGQTDRNDLPRSQGQQRAHVLAPKPLGPAQSAHHFVDRKQAAQRKNAGNGDEKRRQERPTHPPWRPWHIGGRTGK